MTTLEKFKEAESIEPSLIKESNLERLRYFCSLVLSDQDWLDIEQFFDKLEDELNDLKYGN